MCSQFQRCTQITSGEQAAIGEPVGGGGIPSGGGGGGAVEELPPPPPTPDVSQSEPSQAMAAVGGLPPVQLGQALGGVSAASGNFLDKQRQEMEANPPQMERPSGSDARRQIPAPPLNLPPIGGPENVERKPEGQAIPVPQPTPVPQAPAPPASRASPPGSADDLGGAVAGIPTDDPNVQTDAGPPPELELEGNADPEHVEEQEVELEKGMTEAHVEGRNDVVTPMGEHEIYPIVPPEVLKAEIPAGDNGAAGMIAGAAAAIGAMQVGGSADDDAISNIAQEESGDEIQASVTDAQGEMAAQQQEHETQVADERERSNQEIDQVVADNSAEQDAERSAALSEVEQTRGEWDEAQTQLVQDAEVEATEAREQGLQEVEQEQIQADQQSSQEIEKGQTEAENAKVAGEQTAQQEKQAGQSESSGFFGGLFSKAKNFFNKVKNAVKSALEAAQKAVKTAIDTPKKLATAIIEKAREAVVNIIRRVGDVLIAIGDRVLAKFPELRDRFRTMIEERVAKATEFVNNLAEKLKEGVQKALDMLGQVLDAGLQLLGKGLQAIIDKVQSVVEGAIQFAKNAVEALGAFVVLIKDIAANPGQWISNLAAAVKDGIVNHLWEAFKAKVKEWFNAKLEQVLGLGLTIWDTLREGGMTLAKIGKLAWDALIQAIPSALISILIEKLVSMIVPAAGAILTIIEGLKAAWGTVSRIIQAIQQFVSFLKAVKDGQAGRPFAEVLASAAVVVIDFVSNWLLKKLKSAGKTVAGKLKKMAKGLIAKIKKMVKKVGMV